MGFVPQVVSSVGTRIRARNPQDEGLGEPLRPVRNRASGLDPARLEVELRLAGLARTRAPLRRVLAAVAGRLVERRAWERLGYARLRDYAVERAGMSGRSLQDLAHVDGALRELPCVDAALVSGRIGWSKARLLCRVATREDEARWVVYARRVTARALSREVRAVDEGALERGGAGPEDDEQARPKQCVRIACDSRVNGKWFHARQLAQRMAGERLPSWAALEMVTAEVLSALPLDAGAEDPCSFEGVSWPDAADRGAGAAHGADGECTQAPGSEAPDVCATQESASYSLYPVDPSQPGLTLAALPAALRSLVEGLAGADVFELDRRLCRAVALEQRLDADLAPLLRQAVGECLYRGVGYATLAAYARERVGMSPAKARALVRLERAGAACPELRAAYRSGGLSWVQAQALLPLVLLDDSGRWRATWVGWARRVSVRRLEDDVERALLLRETDPQGWAESGGLPEGVKAVDGPIDAERQTCARPRDPVGPTETCNSFVIAPADVARLFRAVLCTVRRRIERQTGRLPSPGEAFEAMLDHALEAWGAPEWRTRTRHRVFERDGWRCTVPGCSSQRNLHDHHIVFRSAGGSDALENRTTLCAWHHQRGVHAGIVRVAGEAPAGLVFELGVRGGEPPLVRYRSGELRA